MSKRSRKHHVAPEVFSIPGFESVLVVDEPTAVKLAGLSPRTWDRMRARGETPPITQLSERRIGYRIFDLRMWLDARRVPAQHESAA
jgi:predicted DNA-binding transcriptional regulator AlpA